MKFVKETSWFVYWRRVKRYYKVVNQSVLKWMRVELKEICLKTFQFFNQILSLKIHLIIISRFSHFSQKWILITYQSKVETNFNIKTQFHYGSKRLKFELRWTLKSFCYYWRWWRHLYERSKTYSWPCSIYKLIRHNSWLKS